MPNLQKQKIRACIPEDEEIPAEIHVMTTMPGLNFVSACSILAEIGSLKIFCKGMVSPIRPCSTDQTMRDKRSFIFRDCP